MGIHPLAFLLAVLGTSAVTGLLTEYVARLLPPLLFDPIEYRVELTPFSRRIFSIIIMAATSALIFSMFGSTLKALMAIVFVTGILTLGLIDHETGYLPDLLTIPLLWIGLMANTGGMFASVNSAIWGAASAYCSLWLLRAIFRLIADVDVLCEGDFKQYAALGAWLGIAYLPAALLIASVSLVFYGYVLERRKNPILPMGPHFSVAGVIGIMIGPQIQGHFLL